MKKIIIILLSALACQLSFGAKKTDIEKAREKAARQYEEFYSSHFVSSKGSLVNEAPTRILLEKAMEAVNNRDAKKKKLFGKKVSTYVMDGSGAAVSQICKYFAVKPFESEPIKYPNTFKMEFSKCRKGGVYVRFFCNNNLSLVEGLVPRDEYYYDWEDVRETFLLPAVAADPNASSDEIFAAASFHWTEIGKGVQCGYAQIPLFKSIQSISVIRYPESAYKTEIVNQSASTADSTSAMAVSNKLKCAINASYFNVKTLYPTTLTVDDGEQVGWTRKRELIRVDGILTVKGRKIDIVPCADTTDYPSAVKGVREAIASGPVLLQNGTSAREVWPDTKFFTGRHPRTIIGVTEDRTIYYIVVDGRFIQGIGSTIPETVEIARLFGLQEALNLDGGGSSTIWSEKTGVINHPYDNKKFDHSGQRIVPNIIGF